MMLSVDDCKDISEHSGISTLSTCKYFDHLSAVHLLFGPCLRSSHSSHPKMRVYKIDLVLTHSAKVDTFLVLH